MRDFEPVASLNFTEMVLMARNDLPVKNVAELIAYAKANPGKLSMRRPASARPIIWPASCSRRWQR